jgi:hypothetical protein
MIKTLSFWDHPRKVEITPSVVMAVVSETPTVRSPSISDYEYVAEFLAHKELLGPAAADLVQGFMQTHQRRYEMYVNDMAFQWSYDADCSTGEES